MSLEDVDRFLDGGDGDFGPKARSARWGKERRNDRCREGAVEKGFIVEDPFPCQQREFKADGSMGDLKFWNKPGTKTPDPDKPMMQLKVIIATDHRDDDEDDGRRAIYIKSELAKEVKTVLKEQNAKLRKGGWLAVKCTGTFVNANGFDTYSWAVKYKPAPPEADSFFDDEPSEADKVAAKVAESRAVLKHEVAKDWDEAEPQGIAGAAKQPQSTLAAIRAGTADHQRSLRKDDFGDEPPF